MIAEASPTQPAPRIAVVIPTWNGLALLRPCLDALRRQTYRAFEVWVVDNGSTDETLAVLARDYPEVHVLALGYNGGLTVACNAGARTACGEFLVMLNNDTEATPGWLAALVEALDRHPEAGLAASRLMLYDRRTVIHSAGDLFRRNGMPDSRGVWQPYGPPFDQEGYVFGACGGAAAYRQTLWEDVGGFEEGFFMYCEDVDLNWRAQLAGWKCLYVPQAVVYHRLSATGGGALASFYVGRNTLWVLARNLPEELWRCHWRTIFTAQWAVAWGALRAWRGKAARARLRGQLAGLLTLGRWRAARRAIQARRRVSLDYLEAILE